ncbi:MAG: hypothetical protein HY961_17525 [Ignavibacteriae bacterium]|nr:hypothetical protein [Ignavibacteriota bacterium]
MIHDRFWWTLMSIGVITVMSGIAQCVVPDFLLQALSPELTSTSRHFLLVTGVLTGSFGALLIHALRTSDWQHVALLWIGIQKILAAGAVGIAIRAKMFSTLALLAAGFDLVAGVMITAFWFWIRQQARAPDRIREPLASSER